MNAKSSLRNFMMFSAMKQTPVHPIAVSGNSAMMLFALQIRLVVPNVMCDWQMPVVRSAQVRVFSPNICFCCSYTVELYHLGFRKALNHTSLYRANENRDYRMFEGLGFYLILLDLRGSIPANIYITDGKYQTCTAIDGILKFSSSGLKQNIVVKKQGDFQRMLSKFTFGLPSYPTRQLPESRLEIKVLILSRKFEVEKYFQGPHQHLIHDSDKSSSAYRIQSMI